MIENVKGVDFEINENLKKTEKINEILTDEALEFFLKLHEEFNPIRLRLLEKRKQRQEEISKGQKPSFLKETSSIRNDLSWKVAPIPNDLLDRRVEITGPAEAKMMINALNSGAQVFMADLEDALSPTWENIINAQINLKKAYRRNLEYRSVDGKNYKLNEKIATLIVRPRGLHLEEKNILIAGERVSASIFDFAFCFFHNATESIRRGTAPYFYLPKLESHLEARFWSDLFKAAEKMLGIKQGTIRATVLIETILAAFEMEEILYELKDYICGLNAGRWDYIFSAIKKFRDDKNFITPDRSQITMTVPFMKAYTELLVQTCHKRGAYAIGGMAAFIPSRKNQEINKIAIEKVKEDKKREAMMGFDGTWVAHPDLVEVAKAEFDAVFSAKNKKVLNQLDELKEKVEISESDLLNFKIENSKITLEGFRLNVNVALQYLERWLSGVGAAAIHNLMEDAATAEISRAQLWQWVHHQAKLETGEVITQEFYKKIVKEECDKLIAENGGNTQSASVYGKAKMVLEQLVLDDWKWDFLTLLAYEMI